MELFKVFYHPATETKGIRVRVIPNNPLLNSRIIPFDYECNNAVEVAAKYLKSLGYEIKDTFVGKGDYILAGGGEWK